MAASTPAAPAVTGSTGGDGALTDMQAVLNMVSCDSPTGPAQVICRDAATATIVKRVNEKRLAYDANISSQMELQMFAADTDVLAKEAAACLTRSDMPCLQKAFMKAEVELANSNVVVAAASASAASEPAVEPGSGVYSYRNSTPAELKSKYEAQAVKMRSELEAKQSSLAVQADCSVTTLGKHWQKPDSDVLAKLYQHAHRCEAEPLAQMLADEAMNLTVRHDGSEGIILMGDAEWGGCTALVRSLLEQCIGLDYGPRRVTLDVVGPFRSDDRSGWAKRKPLLPALMEMQAMRWASDPKGWETFKRDWTPLNKAARAGHPELLTFVLAAGVTLDRQPSESQSPLASAIASYRVANCTTAPRDNAECLDRFELVKMLAVLSKLDVPDSMYKLPLDQAKKDGATEVVALLSWLGAPSDAKSVEPEPEPSPVVKACLAQVQRTLGADIGNGAPGAIQESLVRQARAIKECHQLDEGKAPGTTLQGVANQQGVMSMADRIEQGGTGAQGRYSCQQLAQRVRLSVAAKGATSVDVYDALQEAKRYSCY